MKKVALLWAVLTLATLVACCQSSPPVMEKADEQQKVKSEAGILQSWQDDFPVTQLDWLPAKQISNGVGYISDTETFGRIWEAFKPDEDVPEVDFNGNLVLFVYNTRYYNRVSIGRVNVTNGVAEVLAMETMSAMPIEERVAMSLAVVPREGIRAVRSRDRDIPLQTGTENPQ